MSKKLISFVLFIILAVGSFSMGSQADESTEITPLGLENDKVMLLKHLGIISSDDISGNQKITYEKFYNMYKLLSGTDPSDKLENSSPVTYMYVIKQLVTLANMETYASYKGGYPTGYLAAANEIDLLDGITAFNSEDYIDYDVTLSLIYNLLTEDTPDIVSLSYDEKGGYTFEYGNMSPMLYRTFKIKSGSGILTGTEKSDIYGSPITKDMVKINGRRFFVTDTPDYNLIGHRVKYYYTQDRADYIIILCDDTENQEITTVYSGEFISFTGGKLTYFSEDFNKEKYINIPYGTKVFKNGIFKGYTQVGEPPLDLSFDLTNKRGKIDLIDNNGDKTVDFVSVTEYTVGVIDSVNTVKKIFYFKDNLAKLAMGDEYTVNDKDVAYNLIYDGKSAELDKIYEYDVALICEAQNLSGKMFYDIIIVRDKTSGTITDINLAEGTVGIDGVKYKIAPCIDTALLIPGTYGEFSLAGNREIAYMVSDRAYNYGYIMDSTTKSGLEATSLVKIMTEGSEAVVYPLAKKVSVNGTSKTDALALTDIQSLGNNYRLIAYQLNNENKIYKIFTATYVNQSSSEFSLDADHSVIDTSIINDDRYDHYRDDVFVYNAQFFNGLYQAAEDSVVFFVNPKVPDEGLTPTEDDITVGGANDIDKFIDTTSDYENYLVRAMLYDTDELYRAEAVVIYRDDFSGGKVSSDYSAVAVVDSITQKELDGEIVYNLNYYKDGSSELQSAYAYIDKVTKTSGEFEIPFKYGGEDIRFANLKTGDIIQIGTDRDGFITSFRPVFLIDKAYDMGDYWSATQFPFWSRFECLYSEIQAVDGSDYIVLARYKDGTDLKSKYIRFTKADAGENFIYYKNTKKLEYVPDMDIVNELVPGAKIFMIRSYNKISMQMIIK